MFDNILRRINKRGILQCESKKNGLELTIVDRKKLKTRAGQLSGDTIRTGVRGVDRPAWRTVAGIVLGAISTMGALSIVRKTPESPDWQPKRKLVTLVVGLLSYYSLKYKTMEDALVQSVYLFAYQHDVDAGKKDNTRCLIRYDELEQTEAALANSIA